MLKTSHPCKNIDKIKFFFQFILRKFFWKEFLINKQKVTVSMFCGTYLCVEIS